MNFKDVAVAQDLQSIDTSDESGSCSCSTLDDKTMRTIANFTPLVNPLSECDDGGNHITLVVDPTVQNFMLKCGVDGEYDVHWIEKQSEMSPTWATLEVPQVTGMMALQVLRPSAVIPSARQAHL